jgi:hypothetical protein
VRGKESKLPEAGNAIDAIVRRETVFQDRKIAAESCHGEYIRVNDRIIKSYCLKNMV